ncbi:hypothetical protein [Parasphingorhabdus sp.]|uniref:hypothetical protein n=1 Tax=Parasphingorhabdus sp. TaxID=2709688 RepID=UPI0030035B3C
MKPILADFASADDLLREAGQGRLAGHDSIVLEKSGRIGPLVEIALAAMAHSEQYRGVSVNSSFAVRLNQALQTRCPFGSNYDDCAGAFPLSAINPVTSTGPEWDQWTTHAENIAKAQGLNSHLVAGLLGALIEIQDNIYEHSGEPETGVVAYATTTNSFEFVVADQGIGVLSSLRQNPKYGDVNDAGVALGLAITDGVSRFPSETGHGQGFNQLFRALVGHNAELRFRSGDHALTLRPGRDFTEGASVLAQVAPMVGLSISVFCNDGALP